MTAGELAAAVAELPELPPAERARSASVLLDAARQVLVWERGGALTEARESGSSEAELARGLGVQPSVVRDLLAEHRRAATGRRPASRSRVARQLAQRLTDRTGVPVEIR